MKETRKELILGTSLLAGFACVLVIMFTPIINGQNPINYLDDLYNSISKGSVYYIPDLQKETKSLAGKKIEVNVPFLKEEQAKDFVTLFSKISEDVKLLPNSVSMSGDLGIIMSQALVDSDLMFHNKGKEIASKYGIPERQTMYNWWLTVNAIDKQLKYEERFDESKLVMSMKNKGIECAFNYYGVEPRQISSAIMLVVASLCFYVAYTLLFGFAIMYIFVGFGLKIGH
ncbi:MAG: hypothetical protein MJE63_33460 [Proteobacteria bacterium]|nr:hypothetical protein [Pseudomonadota bacterium]